MEQKEWAGNWIEPAQEDAIEDAPFLADETDASDVTPENGYENLRPCKEIKFEFEVEDDDLAHRAFLYASAHGVYEMSLNGTHLGDALLAPETTNYNKLIWYQSHEVTDLIKPGKNDLRIYLADGWWIGRIGPNGESCQYGKRLGFIGQIEMGNNAIPVDDTAVSRNFFIKNSDLFIGEKWDLTEPESEWEPCTIADYPKDILVAQEIPYLKYIDELPVKEYITTPEGDLVMDFGQVCTGVVELKIKATGKTTVILEHSESLSKEGNFRNSISGKFVNQTDVFVTDKKHSSTILRPMFTFHGFRYVRITGVARENIKIAKAKVIGTPLERTGYFETDHELLNKLQHAIEWSTISNMMSVPISCPHKDRVGKSGDIVAFALTGGFLYDLKGFLRNWLYQLRLDQLENGEVPIVVPGNPAQEALHKEIYGSNATAICSDACVLIPYNLLELYKDPEVLKENLETMKAWLAYIERVDWLHMRHFGGWQIPSLRDDPRDVSKSKKAVSELVTLSYYCMTLDRMVKICSYFEEEDPSHYAKKLETIREKIVMEYIGSNGAVCDGKTQGAYVMAIVSGALDKVPTIKKRAVEKLANLVEKDGCCLDMGFASVPYILDALYDNGYKELAYKILFNKDKPGWLYMADHGATTIWEYMDAVKEDGTVTECSYNSYAYGCIGNWMYAHIGGIQSLAPGFKKIKVAPDREILEKYGVKWCKTRLKCPYGHISIEWNEIGVKVRAPYEVEVVY